MSDESAASECVELVNRVLKKLSRPPATFVTISDAGGAVEVSAQIYGQPVVSKTAATFADARDEAASALLPMIHRIDMPGLQQAAAEAAAPAEAPATAPAASRAQQTASRLSSQFGSALTRQLPPPRVPTAATEAAAPARRSGRRVARAADGVAAVEPVWQRAHAAAAAAQSSRRRAGGRERAGARTGAGSAGVGG